MARRHRDIDGWLMRNIRWVAPVGCASALVLVGGFVAALTFGVFGIIKSSDAYKEALARVQAHEQVKALLGTPIEAGLLVSGRINVSGSSGYADLSFTVEGPKGEAKVYLVAHKRAGRWKFNLLQVKPEREGRRIDLLPRRAERSER